MEFKILSPQDESAFSALVEVFAEAFDVDYTARPGILANPSFLAVVAQEDGRLAGGLTAYVLESFASPRPSLYLYDLAVSDAYRRQGVGTGLIRFLTAYARERGFGEVFVQAHRVDGYALEFYRQTGVSGEEDVVQFYFSL
jgi:aminoglycoside 3-N-acetyltransferase I